MMRWETRSGSVHLSAMSADAALLAARYNELIVAHRAGRAGTAMALARDLLGVAPNHLPTLKVFAQLARQAGDSAAALDALKRALEASPDDATLYAEVAGVMVELGAPDAALDAFNVAVEKDPHAHGARANRANLLARMHRLDDAIAEYAQLERMAPDHIATIANHATILEVAGRASEAARAVARALELAPGDVAIQTLAARMERGVGQGSKALGRMRRVVDESNEPSVAMLQELGHCADHADEFAEAARAYRRANRLRRRAARHVASPNQVLAQLRGWETGLRKRCESALAAVETTGPVASRPVVVVGFPYAGTHVTADLLRSDSSIELSVDRSALRDSAARLIASGWQPLDPLPPTERKLLDARPRSATRVEVVTLVERYLPVLYAMSPDARYVRITRSRADVLLGCLTTTFSEPALEALCAAPTELAEAYLVAERVWQCFVEVCRPAVLDVSYEALLEQDSSTLGVLAEFCGLGDLTPGTKVLGYEHRVAVGRGERYAERMGFA